jgi:hypothetical protein
VAKFVACTLHRANLMLYTAARSDHFGRLRRLPLKAPCAAQAVTRAVIGEQGLITEAGYQEQAKSYEDMANAAGVAIKADKLAAQGAYGGAAIAGVAAVASLFTGGAVGGVAAASIR